MVVTGSVPLNGGKASESGISVFGVFDFYDLINIFNVFFCEWRI